MGERQTAHEDYFVVDTEALRLAVENATKRLGPAAVQTEATIEIAANNKPYGYIDGNLHGSDDWANFN